MTDLTRKADVEHTTAAQAETEEPQAIPPMQRFLDNPFLLLILGIAVPTVFYLVWGIMEIIQIPMAE